MEQFDTDTYDMEQSDNDLPPMMFHSFRYSTITYRLKWAAETYYGLRNRFIKQGKRLFKI